MPKPDIRTAISRPTLDPQKLGHFLAVYETGTFSAAAQQNGVSQQAVSKSVARLEEALGVELFQRSSFGATPTRYAERLARRAQAILSESRMAAAELAAMRGSGSGYVRIGLGWSFLTAVGPEMLRRFKERHPDITLSIAGGDSRALYRRLIAGDVEMVASAPPVSLPVDPGIARQPLFVERDMITLRKGHPLLKGGDLPLDALSELTWCISMQLQQQWERVCEIFLSRGVAPPTNIVDLDSIMLVKSLILKSDSVGLLSPELFAQEHEKALYELVPDTPFTSERTAYLATRDGSELQSPTRLLRELFHRAWRARVPEADHLS
ncbi:LysR family transcriptional regulator [Aurantiacibacter aquimixticola]|uniref:LysR family transcriptional regulator n=1 Tax=Aurantiacibacter aquimixticola TaxID=1958945 RepID=A0A419RW75_9SPHN|nr:LysR family transcriptional regulator [Aurantiacibacter aquimixticola]RJY10042.1 LysR family transcriptional regulator [Aurantiacibacter aquimixticola]